MSALKKTQAVTSMRQSIEDALVRINEGRVDLVKYAGISCETCIHRNKHAFEDPCRSCSSATKEDARDFRTTTRHHWTPDFEAHVDAIREFHKRYPKNDLAFLLEFPPKRCINPKCSKGHQIVHKRGLCKDCHQTLFLAVDLHRDRARDILILASISESQFEYDACMTAYDKLFTWHRFIVLGYALPEEEDYGDPLQELGMADYYSAVRKNDGADPTRRQLYCRGLKKEQVDRLAELVSFAD